MPQDWGDIHIFVQVVFLLSKIRDLFRFFEGGDEG